MSPSDYKDAYHRLQVPVIVDDKVEHWSEVRLDQYVLITKVDKDAGTVTWDDNHPDNQSAHDGLLSKLMAHFAKKGATLTVHVKPVLGGIEHSEFDTWKELWYYARKPFFGKGTPEEAQINLQLAARFGLLKGGTLQAYCDKYLGLDCNGFVGNYLVHGLREGDWQSAEPMGTNYLANNTIRPIIKGSGTAITKMEDLVPVNSYILGMVGQSGQVIDQYEGGSFGHIVITQPPMVWETTYREGTKARQVPTIMAVESTGGVGLCEHGAQFLGVDNTGVFTVRRFSHMHSPPLRFRVYRVL
jgi:hypothetical protein